MPLLRPQVGLAVVNNQLMVIGGFDGSTYLKTVEVYDAESNCWRLCGHMNSRRLGGGVGVVRLAHHEPVFWYSDVVDVVKREGKSAVPTNAAPGPPGGMPAPLCLPNPAAGAGAGGGEPPV